MTKRSTSRKRVKSKRLSDTSFPDIIGGRNGVSSPESLVSSDKFDAAPAATPTAGNGRSTNGHNGDSSGGRNSRVIDVLVNRRPPLDDLGLKTMGDSRSVSCGKISRISFLEPQSPNKARLHVA